MFNYQLVYKVQLFVDLLCPAAGVCPSAMSRTRSSLLTLAFLVASVTLLRVAGPGFVGNALPAPRPSQRAFAVALAAASDTTMGKVADIVAEQLGVEKEKVVGTATLSELGADSLDIVETVMALEEGFDVELPDDETTTLKNVQDVADLIETKL